MKLYYSPGACSLADHIALHEANQDFDLVRVDLKAKLTESGKKFDEINPKGYVPTLELDNGQILTENVAILAWIARRAPSYGIAGELGDMRLLEMLAFISTEIHKQFSRVIKPACDAKETAAREKLGQRFRLITTMMKGDYLFGHEASVADAYLYTMLRWADKAKLDVPAKLSEFAARMLSRPAVQLALKHEHLE